MGTRVSSRAPWCQRWPGLLLLIGLAAPASAAASEPVTLSDPVAQTDAGTGTLEVSVEVANGLPVPIDSIVVWIRAAEQTLQLQLPGTVDAGTSMRLQGTARMPGGGERTGVQIQLEDYRVVGPLAWPDAQRLLMQGGVVGERNFIRQLTLEFKDDSAGPSLETPVSTEPTMNDVVLWTAKALWLRCRADTGERLAQLRSSATIGALEDGFSLLRGAWLMHGRDHAPLSAAIPRNVRRYSDLLDDAACPISVPAETADAGSSPPRERPDRGRSDTHDSSAFPLWIAGIITIFVAGVAIGKRYAKD